MITECGATAVFLTPLIIFYWSCVIVYLAARWTVRALARRYPGIYGDKQARAQVKP